MKTSFKSWLKNVRIAVLKERGYTPAEMVPPVLLSRMLPDGKVTSEEMENLIAKAGDGFLGDSFRELWEAYTDYDALEDAAKARPGDTATYKVRDLEGGYSLWRCINVAGSAYSTIRDPRGREIMSLHREKEERLLRSFNERFGSGARSTGRRTG